jgi:hypothetical protein
VGAHQLAAGDRDAARASFAASRAEAGAAGSRAEALLAEGYEALAEPAGDPERFEAALAAIAAEEDGAELRQQLETARRVLAP